MKQIQNYDTIIGFKSKIVINQKPINKVNMTKLINTINTINERFFPALLLGLFFVWIIVAAILSI